MERCITKFLRPRREDNKGYRFDLLWSEDKVEHAFGELSYSVSRGTHKDFGNKDFSQVEVASRTTYAGIYDGHGGPLASFYLCRYLLRQMIRLSIQRDRVFDEQVFRNSLEKIQERFTSYVLRNKESKEDYNMYHVGTSAIFG